MKIHKDIRMFRLQNNIDIISECESDNSIEIKLINPFEIYMEYNDANVPVMILKPWLPLALIESKEVYKNLNDMLELQPTAKVIDFYLRTTKKFDEINNDIEFDSDDFGTLEDVDDLKTVSKLKKKNLMN